MIVAERFRGGCPKSVNGVTFLLAFAFTFISTPTPLLFVLVSARTTADNNPSNNGNGGDTRYNKDYYQARADSLSSSPCNPLWRENQVYTGERRGPIPISDRKESSALERTRRRTTSSLRDLSGRLSIGFSFRENDSIPERRRQRKTFPRRSIGLSDSTTASAAIASTRNAKDKHRNKFAAATETAVVERADRAVEAGSVSRYPNASRGRSNDGIEVSLSLDPFSLASLIQCLAATSLGMASVYVGTLKLLGPMILAKQCLTRVGYVFYDHYNGRYLRKTLNERVHFLRKYEIIAAARAASRSLVQVVCMGLTGQCVGFILDRTKCVLKPPWLCHWWYGVVWLSFVCAIGWACEEWGFDFLAVKANSKFRTSLASLKADRNDDRSIANLLVPTGRPGRRARAMASPPWQFVRRLCRDPEEMLKSLLRVVPGRKGPNGHSPRGSGSHAPGRSVDDSIINTLLFPSTWRPLYGLTLLAFSRAICLSFDAAASSPSSGGGPVVAGFATAASCWRKNRNLVLRLFVIQNALHSEWHRSFVQEGSLALGACVSLIDLLALLWSIYVVSVVDRISAFALIPVAMARLVSGWMSFLLHCDRSNFVDNYGAFDSRQDTAPPTHSKPDGSSCSIFDLEF
eukprot:jgi/Psemu1/325459/estExt_fgenesh1_pg.C_2440022